MDKNDSTKMVSLDLPFHMKINEMYHFKKLDCSANVFSPTYAIILEVKEH